MKYIDEFRDRRVCENLATEISKIGHGRDISLMEVCGTHTMSIYRYGIKKFLLPNIRLLSGPGCPVCVTPNGEIDKAIAFARKSEVIITTFGDMLKVPGSTSTLAVEKSRGSDVRIVYSAVDCLKIAEENPDKTVVFLGIGFETTAPTVAATIKDAKDRMLKNYFVLCYHKLIPPVIKAVLESGEVLVDGFILPGHVSVITGTEVYEFIARDYRKACVVTGFEPVDILQAIFMLVKQVKTNSPVVENQYTRSVKKEGNLRAKCLMDTVFEPVDCEWRGLGSIPMSGLKIRDEYSVLDANTIEVDIEPLRENPECICGEVLRGVKTPLDCSLFRIECLPENPKGPCMISSEGTCAAYYKYGK